MSDDELWKIKDTDPEAWAAGRSARAHSIYNEGLKRVATTPMPEGQKYAPGTFVQIAKNLGNSMSHFEKDRPARIEYTYCHAYGGSDSKQYSLIVRYDDGSWNSVAWYYESQLEEIKDEKLIAEYLEEIKRSDQESKKENT